ncbi:ERF family protein [[Kitasatospora] papulosa]|uniref:ERF family protein n=1 Tax=[Kitasatospora] papulosa TaxID=1464011 RepID=UPI0036889681
MTVTALHPAQPPTAPQPFPAVAPAAEIVYEAAPAGAPTDAPRVFAAINGVMRDALPVGKDQTNTHQNYKFRGIDDVMSAMAGPMRTHGVFILPSIAAQKQERDGKITRTLIKMRYRIYGPAGDCLIAEIPGESFDTADKSMNKAQAAALKYLLFTLFMLPVDGRSIDDGDRDHPQPSQEHRAERQQNRQNRQQRGQQRQQQTGQARRSNQAEPGPWEQPQPQQRRDYLAEAQRSDNPHQFAKIRAAAAENGAPADYLARLDAIAAKKRAAAEQGQQGAPQQGKQAPPPSTPKSPEVAAEQAENALRLAASKANLPTLDADFQTVYGIPVEQATAQQLDTFRERIEAAGGAQ